MSRKARAESILLEDTPVYHLPVQNVVTGLNTHIKKGLDDDQVLGSRAEYGSNALEQAKPKNPFVMFFFHMFNTVTFILYAVFAIAMVNNELVDAVVIMFIVVANAIIGFIQEWKSEMSLNALQRMSAGTAEVVRNGSSQVVGIDEVVVGDVVILKQGYQVPADARLVEAINLEVDEALLTGESMPVVKHTLPLDMPEQVNGLDVRVALGDRANMVFRQTIVVAGTGVAVVTATGYDTKVGQLSKALQSGGDEKTPMQKNMDYFLLVIFGMALVIAFIIFCITKLTFAKETVLYASATGIAILPESLVAVVTVSLALAVTRMSGKRAIVRKIASVEVLGTVTNICSDKTGTLTEGKMVVKRVWPAGSKYVYHVTGGPMDATAGFGVELAGAHLHAASETAAPSFPHEVPAVDMHGPEAQFSVVQAACEELAMVAGMCNNTQLQVDEENDKLVGTGTPTELALSAFAFKAGLSPAHFEAQGWRTCGQWAFDSSVKCMSMGVVRARAGAETQRLVLCKGAPEAVLPKCRAGAVSMDAVMEKVNNLASQGFRVLACAIGEHLPLDDIDGKRLHDFPRPQVEAGLRFVGLCMVLDPPRPESASCVERCREAGIQFHMVTGDHQLTAENIARRIHILQPHDGRDRIVTGPVFDAMSEEQIDAMGELPLVIARCSPESKVKMVQALHRRGKVVAMTGDGINDAPAIKMADVGAAMGIAGVDVTKNTADIVLTDDNIATLVSAVEEGRHVAASVRKFVVHILTGNFAEVIVLLCGLAFKDDNGDIAFPLAPLQILWINMITSTPPAIGLSLDPLDPDAMQKNPDTGSFFNKFVVLDQAVYGAIAAALCFISYVFVLFAGNDHIGYGCNGGDGYDTCAPLWRARATCFVTMNIILLCHGYVCRHTHRSLTEFSLINNKVLLWSVLGGTSLLFPILYVPVIAHKIFKHNAITWEWAVCLVCLALFLCGTEVYKYIKRKYKIDFDRTLTRADIAANAAAVQAEASLPAIAPATVSAGSPAKPKTTGTPAAVELSSVALGFDNAADLEAGTTNGSVVNSDVSQ